jgi:tetratricopeptide (TPR) repeat protein
VKAHAAEVDLLALAMGRESDAPRGTRGHVASCATCARREAELKTLAAAVALEAELAAEVENAAPYPETARAAAHRDRLARLVGESDAAIRDADAVLEIARNAAADLEALVAERTGSPAGRLALVYSLQRGSFGAALPQRALALAKAVLAALPTGSSEDPPTHAVLAAEAHATASQALLGIGRLPEARDEARNARAAFRASGGDVFSLAVCDYYEASVMCFQGAFGSAERLLETAARVFADLGQDTWLGRAEAALASSFSQRGEKKRALAFFDAALERFDAGSEPNVVAVLHMNRARCLAALGFFEKASQGYAQSLQVARHHRMDALVFGVRQNLAELEMLRGEHESALASYRAVVQEADRLGLEEDQIVTRFAVAECLGRLGRTDEMIASLRETGRLVAVTDLRGNPAWNELTSRLDPGDVDVGLVSEVRRHLEAALDGYALPFRASKRA